MNNGLYVQYGCGWSAAPGWLNFDSSPTLRIERIPLVGKTLSSALKGNPEPFPDDVRYGDIVKGLPVSDDSCVGVYCSHVLEHLSLEDCRKALANTKRILRFGGTFRFVLPDLAFYARQYVSGDGPDSALEFMRVTLLGEQSRRRGVRGIVGELIGNSRHRWMWDYSSLERELREQGFEGIKRVEFGDSADPMFCRVERQERWRDCLGIECST